MIQTFRPFGASHPHAYVIIEAALLSSVNSRDSVVVHEPQSIVDAQLVAAARRGEVRAFEKLYQAHSARVYGLCLRMTRSPDVAEECVQMAFVRAWQKLQAFEGRSAFGTWLHRIAVNEVLSHRRNRSTRQESDDESVTQYAESDVGVQRFDPMDVLDVERALETLPEGARDAIVLQTVYGYSHEEVSEMLGVAVGTCKAQVHRGRRLLRERLGMTEVVE